MSFIRKIKKKSGIYLAEVRGYRENGKVKQQVIKYLGKEINGKVVKKVNSNTIEVKHVKQSLDILCIKKMIEELKLDSIEDKKILALVYSQLLENKSINKLEEWFRFTEIPEILGIGKITSTELYNSINNFKDVNFEKIETDLHNIFSNFETEKTCAIIDVTDTYFEGDSRNEKPRKGKDGKVCKLAQFGLAVTLKHGFPVLHNTYQGNLSDINIFKDMTLKLKEKGMDSIIVDRGMTSEENLDIILTEEMTIISGIRKNEKLFKDYISQIKREEVFSLKNRVVLKNTKVYIKSFDYKKGKLIVVYNPEIELAKREEAFDQKIDENKGYGYSLVYNNTSLSDEIAVKRYYEKDTVERAFKKIKGILNLRPVRCWLQDNVESHFKICFLAYAILSYIEYKLQKINTSAIEALESLKYGYKVRLKDDTNKHEWDLYVPLQPKQKNILKRLGVVYKK